MQQRISVRGIVRASLAIFATTALAGPSEASGVMPAIGFSARAIIGDGEDSTVSNPPHADTDTAAPPAHNAAAGNSKEVRRADGDSTESRHSLSELVRTFSMTTVPDPERECLAGAIYFEARGEPIEGQLAVAEVVLNRAASGEYPTSICGVVKQPWQFSFVRDGNIPEIDKGSEAWRRAVAVAHIAAEDLADKLSSDVLWYHAHYVAPDWGRRLNRVTQIGAHIFYRRG